MRYLQVYGPSNFKLGIPDDARTTFAPWAPANAEKGWRNPTWANGTLRVYQGAGEKNCLGVFSPVYGFRDEVLEYVPEVRVAAPPQQVPQAGRPMRWAEGAIMEADEGRRFAPLNIGFDEARAFPMDPEPVELEADFNQ